MNIFVCIKQVPSTNKVEVDEKTGVLKRDGVASKMNPYDLYALETALRLKEKHGGKITVGTMGPPQAQAVVREAYMMGADEGYVFSDRRLGGADVLATSYTLSQAIRSVGDFDLILCGRQTTDGDTAQVGPAIAEHLGIPHAAWVGRLEAVGDGVDAEQHLQDVIETVHMPFPLPCNGGAGYLHATPAFAQNSPRNGSACGTYSGTGQLSGYRSRSLRADRQPRRRWSASFRPRAKWSMRYGRMPRRPKGCTHS